jgi:glyoxylase-like metal-dependent hydrolase (beta-lactamase superfamily II)
VRWIPTPTPYDEVPTANSYFLEGPPTVIDCGVDTPDAWRAFVAGLDRAGYRLEQVERILITHAHPDHMGFAKRLRELSGATILVGEREARSFGVPARKRFRRNQAIYREFFRRLGLSEEIVATMIAMREMSKKIAPPFRRFETVAEGDVLEQERFALRVMETPGHTYGLICLHEPDRRFFFSSDHLLQATSPNPVLDLGPEGEEDLERKFRSLVSYYEQIRRVEQLSLDCILPGHGSPFVGHRRVIESLMRFYERRQRRIRRLLRKHGPQSVSALSRRLFPRLFEIKAFLVTCEVLGNLEVLEEMGGVARAFDGTHYLFRAVGDPPFER